ncbi:MAG TPA: family 43 glycosylhydrolase [Chloroflexia bacterium]|nr:family 43 glycosylhydrolase [Chloroflexia bacterium]
MLQHRRFRLIPLFGLLVVALVGVLSAGGAHATLPATYTNPVLITIPNSPYRVETFADPAVIQGNDGFYYAYATSDPLHGNDRDGGGNFIFHKVPMARSADLVTWTYIGDAFSSAPSWLEPDSGIWAPDVRFFNGLYYLYYVGTDAQPAVSGEPNCHGDNGIGVATSPNPYGPWTDLGVPVVSPRRAGGGCNFFWTFDPDVLTDENGLHYIYFGSYYGGIHVRLLSKDGTTADPATDTQVAIGNRYEAPYVIFRNGYYYLFASATDCCNGPLSGYSVFAGRSLSPLGPFVDRQGVSLMDSRVGGTPVISMNGNRWVGPGHNAVLTDAAGQDWFFYHAIDRFDAHLSEPNPQNINKRPMLMDRLDWILGWPTVNSGYWASDTPQPAPITTPGPTPVPSPPPRPIDVPGSFLPQYSDEFNGTLGPQWSWVRQPVSTTYSLTEHPGFFRFRTQDADLYQDNNSASILIEAVPLSNFLAEVKFEFNLPPEGCCFNYRQAGMLAYQNDDSFLKLAHVSIWETRQTEWAKEVPVTPPQNTRRYGNTVIGPPGVPGVLTTTTWLRIAKRTDQGTGEQFYTGYSSADGTSWVRGATWTHAFTDTKIGLISMGGPDFIADFDYVHLYTLAPQATATPLVTPSGTATAVAPTTTRTSTALPATSTRTAIAPSVTQTSVAPSATRTQPAPSNTATRSPVPPSQTSVPPSQTRTAVPPSATTVPPSATQPVPSSTPAATETPCTISFSDVHPTDYFYTPVLYLACHGVVSGYNDGTFRPYANATRAQMVKIVVLGFGKTLVTPPAGSYTFADVPPSHPFFVYIETAAANQIVSGYACGSPDEPCDGQNRPYFRPYANVTRGQLSKITVIAAGWTLVNPPGPGTFADVLPNSAFYEFVETAACHGIVSGYMCGGPGEPCDAQNRPYFRAYNNATRGQIAKIVYLGLTGTQVCAPAPTVSPGP